MKILKKGELFKVCSVLILSIALILGTMGNQYAIENKANEVEQNQVQDENEIQNEVQEQEQNQTENETQEQVEEQNQTQNNTEKQNEENQVKSTIQKQIQEETQTQQEQENKISVMYNTHIQDKGWEADFSKKDGEMSGTSGKCLRLEAIKIKLANAGDISIKYQTHVETEGWQDWKSDGEMSGTSGKCYRLEGIKIKLENTNEYSVMYRVHVQDIGWQDWKSDGELAGTTGQSKRLEAIEIKIVDKIHKGKLTVETEIADEYYKDSILQISGWKMATKAGTTIKATLDEQNIDEINYVERQDIINSVKDYGTIKENPTPGFNFQIDLSTLEDGNHTLKIELQDESGKIYQTYTKTIVIDRGMHVKYRVHADTIGWQDWRTDGEMAGTSGRQLRVEALRINGINMPEGVTISYQAHVENIGWQKWTSNGELAGTTGKSYRLEALRIKLEGTDEYSIMYRAHVQDIGWQDWCYDGETAGTCGTGKRVEAIEIKIVPKINETKVEICVDTPSSSTAITKETQKISGWVMTSVPDTELQFFIDGFLIDSSNVKRAERQDVLNAKKGYGNEENNKYPGFELYYDMSSYSVGVHTLTIRVVKDNEVLQEKSSPFTLKENVYYGTGTYGMSGLKIAGDWRGVDLPYYQYGSGPNVFYATFAIHGFEDLWSYDGRELVQIANDFYQRLVNSNDKSIADKWTIYIFPGVNQDGLNTGWTNNGPGRTTLFSAAPGNKGIDLNRCWQIGSSYQRYSDDRNYNGTAGFQAYESQYLRNFLVDHRSTSGKTVLVDLHGWTQQLIGDSGICSYYRQQFPENDGSSIGRYGTGYLINWARSTLGARAALIELPNSGVNGHQSVVNNNFSNRYIEATLNMLRSL